MSFRVHFYTYLIERIEERELPYKKCIHIWFDFLSNFGKSAATIDAIASE